MDQIRLGEGAFQIYPVLRVMQASPQNSKLLENWREFAQNLKLDVSNFEKKVNSGEIQSDEVLRHILRQWKANSGAGATLQVLVDTLKISQLTAMSESIRERFEIKTVNEQNKTKEQEEASQSQSQSNWFDVHRVVLAMRNSVSFSYLSSKWTLLALNLGLGDYDIMRIRDKASRRDVDPLDVLYDVITMWRSHFGLQANLDSLCEALIQCGLRDMAQSVKENFSGNAIQEQREQILDTETSTSTENDRLKSMAVGRRGCEVSKVARELMNSYQFPHLLQHWKSFAFDLGLHDTDIQMISRKQNVSYGSANDIIYDILSLWVAMQGSSATLCSLCDALWKSSNGALADSLESKFADLNVNPEEA